MYDADHVSAVKRNSESRAMPEIGQRNNTRIIAPPIEPYVRVSYTALHLYRNYKESQNLKIVNKGIDQTWPISFLYAQNSGRKKKIYNIPSTSPVPSKSRVSTFKYIFVGKITSICFIQFHKILVYSLWSLPLFNDDTSNFMSQPLAKFIQESFDT